MKKLYAVLFVFVSLISFNCQKEVSRYELPGTSGNDSPDPVTATVQGNVVDESGAAAAGVAIKAGNKSVLTDAKGYFRIINAGLDKTASVVTAEKAGYFKAYRTFQATNAANHINIKLTKRKLAGTISSSGGEVTLSNGAKVALPASAVVKAAGGSYSGDIKVYAAYIDPTANDIGSTIPGSFMADNASHQRVILASFGMLAVELESSAAEKLQIAGDKEATLTMPIPASLQSAAPASISLWYVDEQTGIWKEEGKATRSGNNYTGTVKHFSFWNCDIGLPAVNLSFTLKNEKGLPIAHTLIRLTSKPTGASVQAYGFTDSLGGISGLVPVGETLTVDVMGPECSNVIYSTNIGPFSSNTDLGTITVTTGASVIVTVKGKITNCNGQPVTNGTALVGVGNSSSYVSTNQNGEFSLVYIKCDNNQQAISVVPIDNTTMQQGIPATFSVSAVTEVNAGTLVACGISASQFILYKVNGTEYSFSNLAPQDSMYFYSRQGQQNWQTSITGYNFSQSKMIDLMFTSPTLATGTYPIDALSVNEYGMISVQAGSTITVTSFPATAGQYFEGTFSGQFVDSLGQGPVRTITGSFRLRK